MAHRYASRLGAMAVALGTAASVLTLSTANTPADAAVRGSVKMVGEKPVSGTYNFAYKNYSGTETTCQYHSYGGYNSGSYCSGKAYRVSKGTAEVKLRSYKISEGMKKYDYYLVDVEVANAGRAGTSTGGWMKVHIEQAGSTKIIDHTDSVSKSSDSKSCVNIYPSFGAGWGSVSAGISFDPISFCGKGSSVAIDSRSGLHTAWMAHNLRAIKSFVTERIVKVPAGAHPKFKVSVHVPTDTCTQAWTSYCTAYKNGDRLVSYTIGTSGN